MAGWLGRRPSSSMYSRRHCWDCRMARYARTRCHREEEKANRIQVVTVVMAIINQRQVFISFNVLSIYHGVSRPPRWRACLFGQLACVSLRKCGAGFFGFVSFSVLPCVLCVCVSKCGRDALV